MSHSACLLHRRILTALLVGFGLVLATGCGSQAPEQGGANATHAAAQDSGNSPVPAPSAFEANATAVLAALRSRLEDNDLVRAERLLAAWRTQAGEDERFAALEKRFARAERNAREYALRTELDNIPARNVEKRLELYERLRAVAPGNAEDAKHLERYRNKLAQKNHRTVTAYFKNTLRTKTQHDAMLRLMRRALDIDPENSAFRKTMTRLEYDGLRFPEGDGPAELALDDEGVKSGKRTVYVWVYNVGDVPLAAAPGLFALDVGNATFAAVDGSVAPERVEPGAKAEGRLVFDTAHSPRSLRFAPTDEAVVERFFPLPSP